MLAQKLKNKIVWSTAVQVLGKLLQMAIGIVAIKLVTNALGPAEYGIYGKISEYALFFATAANLGIFGNTVRKMSEDPSNGKIFINALYLRIVSALIVFSLATLYAFLFSEDPRFAVGVLFFISSLLFDYITSVCDGMLQANYLMGRATLALVIGRLINLLAIVSLTSSDIHSAPMYFLAPLSASLVTALLTFVFVHKKIKFVWKFDKKLIKELLLTSLPFGIINIINNLYFRFLPSYFAATALSDAKFGTYNISMHIASTAGLLSTFLMFSALPILKQSLHEKHFDRAKNIYKTIKKSLLILSVILVTIGPWAAPLSIKFLSGKEFIIKELWFVLPLLLVLAAVSYFYDLVLITIFALEKDIWFMKREIIALLCSLLIFGSSLMVVGETSKIFLIILAAIVGESIMVIFGMRKINEMLKLLHEKSINPKL